MPPARAVYHQSWLVTGATPASRPSVSADQLAVDEHARPARRRSRRHRVARRTRAPVRRRGTRPWSAPRPARRRRRPRSPRAPVTARWCRSSGSITWCRSRPSSRIQRRRNRELVATAPVAQTRACAIGSSRFQGSRPSTRHASPSGGRAGDAEVAADVHAHARGTERAQLVGDEVGGEALADPAGIEAGAGRDAHGAGVVVDVDRGARR